jgi:phage shock protein C
MVDNGVTMTSANPTSEAKVLRRQNAVIAGVCGGLGNFFGIKAFWFRLLFVFLLLPGGLPGFIPYLVLWLVVPKRRS